MSGSEPTGDPERVERAAALLERLLTDAEFRARFRSRPEVACREAGLTDLADEIRMGGGALQTLEVRESRSSLLGVLMAAALEGVGVLELSHLGSGLGGEAARAAHLASTRAGLRAVQHPGHGLHAPHVPNAPHAPRLPHAQLPHTPHQAAAAARHAASAAGGQGGGGAGGA
ncbi:MAG: hypothetical protein ACXVSA_22950, partial [Solirubrobacteraceae bacterium]